MMSYLVGGIKEVPWKPTEMSEGKKRSDVFKAVTKVGKRKVGNK